MNLELFRGNWRIFLSLWPFVKKVKDSRVSSQLSLSPLSVIKLETQSMAGTNAHSNQWIYLNHHPLDDEHRRLGLYPPISRNDLQPSTCPPSAVQ